MCDCINEADISDYGIFNYQRSREDDQQPCIALLCDDFADDEAVVDVEHLLGGNCETGDRADGGREEPVRGGNFWSSWMFKTLAGEPGETVNEAGGHPSQLGLTGKSGQPEHGICWSAFCACSWGLCLRPGFSIIQCM